MPVSRRHLISALAALPISLAALPVRAQDGDDQEQAALEMEDLYLRNMDFSPLAEGLVGQQVTFSGFMAPPLRAESNFFVLTRRPMAVCPFCETDADWPRDILAVYTQRVLRPVAFNVRIEVRGELQLGGYTDPDTGFRSRARLQEARWQRA